MVQFFVANDLVDYDHSVRTVDYNQNQTIRCQPQFGGYEQFTSDFFCLNRFGKGSEIVTFLTNRIWKLKTFQNFKQQLFLVQVRLLGLLAWFSLRN